MRSKNLINKLLFCIISLGLVALVGIAHGQDVPVSAQTFRDVAIYPTREAHASTESLNNSTISSEISGTIILINAEIGQRVSKDDVLIQLDSTDYRLILIQAKANLDAARSKLDLSKKQLERSRQLVEKGFISPEALNIREADHSNAEANLQLYYAQYETAKRNVKKCTITSPFDGIVSSRLGNLGEISQPGSPLLQIHDLNSIEVEAKIQPIEAASLKDSLSVQFLTNGTQFPLRIKRIAPIISEEDRYQKVRLLFVGKIPPIGAPGIIKWSSKKPHVPVDLIVRRDGRLGVFLLEKGKARFKILEAASEGNPSATDISLDSIIITYGQHQLQDNQAVNVTR